MIQRIKLLEQVISTKGWSKAVERELAEEWGVKTRQIRAIKLAWQKERLEEYKHDNMMQLPELLTKIDRVFELSIQECRLGPALGAVKLKAELLGLTKAAYKFNMPQEATDGTDPVEQANDSLEGALQDSDN